MRILPAVFRLGIVVAVCAAEAIYRIQIAASYLQARTAIKRALLAQVVAACRPNSYDRCGIGREAVQIHV